MSIAGIVSGIWIAMTGAEDGNTAGTVLNTAQLIYAIEQKTKQAHGVHLLMRNHIK